MKNKIYYLSHPYTNNPEESFRFAVKWFKILREKNMNVFSPILHSHPFHKIYCKEEGISEEEANNRMKYVELDLAFMEAMKDNLILLMSYDAFDVKDGVIHWKSEGCKREYEKAKELGIPIDLAFEHFLFLI